MKVKSVLFLVTGVLILLVLAACDNSPIESTLTPQPKHTTAATEIATLGSTEIATLKPSITVLTSTSAKEASQPTFTPKDTSSGSYSPTLGELIQVNGPPDLVSGSIELPIDYGSNVYFNLIFIFTNKGFMVSTSGLVGLLNQISESDKPKITLDMDFNKGFKYFEPGYQNLPTIFIHSDLAKILVPWQGLQSFDFYCRGYNGTPCKYHW